MFEFRRDTCKSRQKIKTNQRNVSSALAVEENLLLYSVYAVANICTVVRVLTHVFIGVSDYKNLHYQ